MIILGWALIILAFGPPPQAEEMFFQVLAIFVWSHAKIAIFERDLRLAPRSSVAALPPRPAIFVGHAQEESCGRGCAAGGAPCEAAS